MRSRPCRKSRMVDAAQKPRRGYARLVSDMRSFSAKVRRLPSLSIELTERCNNNCQHCYINRPARDLQALESEMSTDFVVDLIRQSADLGCLDVRFTGGEPLLRDDFKELYVFARRNGFSVLLYTNARLITEELAALFRRLPPGEAVYVTSYGMSPETYDRVSGVSGSYDEYKRGIGLLEENRVPYGVKMAVMPDNKADVPAFEDWVGKRFEGLQKPVFITDFVCRARRDDPGKNSRIRALRGTPEDSVEFSARMPDYVGGMRDFCRQFCGRKGPGLFTCGFGETVCVDAYGFAQGCLMLRHPETVYDLRKGSIKEALFEFFPTIRTRRAANPGFLERCALCHLRGLCEQCPAHSWMEHGDLDTPVEFQCRIAHAHACRLGILNADERGWEIPALKTRLDLLAGEFPGEDEPGGQVCVALAASDCL